VEASIHVALYVHFSSVYINPKWIGSCKHVADALLMLILIKTVHLVGLLCT